MREIEMPFGERLLNISIPDEAIVTEVIDQPAIKFPERYTREVLEAPLGCERLSKIASKGDRVAIIVPDVTRPGNFRSVAIKGVLEELHHAGVTNENIFIINGVGSHRKNTEAELEKMLSPEIFHAYPVFTHDHKDKKNLIELGTSSLGDPVIINRKVAEADIIIDIGLVHPQPSAG